MAYYEQLVLVVNETNMDDVNQLITSTEVDADTFLAEKLGPRYKGMAEAYVLTLMYCAIFVTGVIGNVCTCVVIVRNVDMHTATNCYLFSLAVSDTLTLIFGLPPEVYTVWEAYPWRFGEGYCLFKTFLTETTSSASVLTILAFTVERYAAICHPLRARAACSSSRRAIWVVLAVWCVACLTALPYPLHARLFYYYVNMENSLQCGIELIWLPRMRYVFQFSTFLLFILPMIVITTLYVHIGITLHHAALRHHTSSSFSSSSTQRLSYRAPASGSYPGTGGAMSKVFASVSYHRGSNLSANQQQQQQQRQPRRVMLKMLVAVVVAFFVCWAPYHSQRLMAVYIDDEGWTPALHTMHDIFFTCSGFLYFVSATVNPLLYNLMSGKYRRAFRDTLCCFLASSRQRTPSSTYRWPTNGQTGSALGDHAKRSATVLVTLANRSVTILPSPNASCSGGRLRPGSDSSCNDYCRSNTLSKNGH